MKKNELFEKIFNEPFKVEKYSFELHRFNGRICGKQYCTKCGLINLNNDFSRWAVAKGCNNELHADYSRIKKLTGVKNG